MEPNLRKRLLDAPRSTIYHLFLFVYEFLFLLFRFPELLPTQIRLWEDSLTHNPYKAFRMHPDLVQGEKQEMSVTYGEASLPTSSKILDFLMKQSPKKEKHHFIDLGSGRGRLVLLAAAKELQATGIELLPTLHETASYAKGQQLELATFRNEDILKSDFSTATMIWVNGSCWSISFCEELANRLASLPQNPWIISVSRPLLHTELPLQHTIHGWATWGKERFFLHKKINLK